MQLVYEVGDIVYVRVSNIQNYGVFVKLDNGYSGLIHISELSFSYVRKISALIEINSYIFARIIDIDHNLKQVRLSYKSVYKKRERYKNTPLIKKLDLDPSPLFKELDAMIDDYLGN